MHTTLSVLSHVLATGSTGSTTTAKKGSSIVPFVVLIALFGVAYLAFIRPARNRQRAAIQQRRSAEVGDEITTTAGLIATVVAVDDDYITLEVAPGVHSRYLPAAILRVNSDDDEYDDDDEDHDHDGHDHDGHDHDHDGHDHGHDHGGGSSIDLSKHEVIEAPTESTGESTTDTTDGTTSA